MTKWCLSVLVRVAGYRILETKVIDRTEGDLKSFVIVVALVTVVARIAGIDRVVQQLKVQSRAQHQEEVVSSHEAGWALELAEQLDCTPSA